MVQQVLIEESVVIMDTRDMRVLGKEVVARIHYPEAVELLWVNGLPAQERVDAQHTLVEIGLQVVHRYMENSRVIYIIMHQAEHGIDAASLVQSLYDETGALV